MISVQNHLLRSSGSKILILFLLLALLSSCGIFKKDKRYRKPVPRERKVKKTRPQKVDTISWKEDPVIEIPTIEEDLYEKYGSEFKSVYRIGIALPLKHKSYLEEAESMKNDVSYRFINYYGGVLMALEDLKEKDLSFHVEILNTSINNNDSQIFLNKLNRLDLDLIIGPYERELLKEVARYGKRKDIPVVSPWQSSSKIAVDNPNYIQLRPDIKTFFKSLVEHVDEDFIPQQVFLVGRESNKQEMNRLKYLQEIHLANPENSFEPLPFNIFHVEEDSLTLGKTAFDSIFVDQIYREIAVILPNWSYRDEQFIYSCTRKLNAEKGGTKVHVYGMPILLESDKIGYNLYKNLNMKIALSSYVDKNRSEVDDFRKRYYKLYHTIPTKDAFEGYDVMTYIARNMYQHGTKFQYFLPDSYQEFLHTAYEITPVSSEDDIIGEKLEEADYFENMHIDVWHFNYDGFEKIN